MRKYILTVTLNPALDKMVDLQGEEIFSAGGKGINVSRTLRGLKIPTIATGILGGDTGRAMRRILKKENLPHDFIFIKNETRVNVTNNSTRLMGIGPSVTGRDLLSFEKKFKMLLKKADVVTINGRNAEGAPVDYYRRLLHLAKKQNILTALDASGIAFHEALKARPFLIKPNLLEAQQALGMTINSLRDIKKALAAFQKKGIAVTLISLAERGAAAIFKEEFWYCRVPKVTIKNEVGCGDAFLGGFLCAFQRQQPFAQALQFAAACGTCNGQSRIPGKINESDVKKLISKVRLKKL